MMRVYTVPDEAIKACGFEPNHSLRFEPLMIETVSRPQDADVILPPICLSHLNSRADLMRVPCVREHEPRCAFFNCADHYAFFKTTAMLIRCNLNQERLADSPNSISWPWPVEDFGDQVPTPPVGGFRHFVGFHGWSKSKDTVQVAFDSCRCVFGDSFDGTGYPDFAGYLPADGPEFKRRRAGFVESLHSSRVQLCPESIAGVFRYRVLESLTARRVPVVVSSGLVLPWADEIRWERIALFIEERDASNCGEIIKDFLVSHTNEQLLAMGAEGRAAWEKWLNRDDWVKLFTIAVERKARKLGLVKK